MTVSKESSNSIAVKYFRFKHVQFQTRDHSLMMSDNSWQFDSPWIISQLVFLSIILPMTIDYRCLLFFRYFFPILLWRIRNNYWLATMLSQCIYNDLYSYSAKGIRISGWPTSTIRFPTPISMLSMTVQCFVCLPMGLSREREFSKILQVS